MFYTCTLLIFKRNIMKKKLKLNQINENEFSKDEMKNVLGGETGWPFCFTNCDCSEPNSIRKSRRKSARNGNPL